MDDHHHQLLSILITLLILTLLYLPTHLRLFSPLLLSPIALFLSLLRSATLQNIESKTDNHSPLVGSLRYQLNVKYEEVCLKSNLLHFQLELDDGVCSKSKLDNKSDDPFVEWDVRAPLEVIYEEESEDEDSDKPTIDTCLTRHSSSLSKYFPETDSDTTSSDEYPDWDGYSSPGKICYKWDEDDANELIEIELENKNGLDFDLEESMFEIDISLAT